MSEEGGGGGERAPYRYSPTTGLVTGHIKCHCKGIFDF